MSSRIPLSCAVALLLAAAAQAFAQPSIRRIELDSVRPPDGYITLRIQARTTESAQDLANVFTDLPHHSTRFPRLVSEAREITCSGSALILSYTSLFRPKTGGIDTVRSINRMQHDVRADRIAYRWKSDRVTNGFIDAVWGTMLFTTVREPQGNVTIIDYISGVRPRSSIKRVAVWSHRDRLANDAEYFVKQLIEHAAKSRQSDIPLFPCKP